MVICLERGADLHMAQLMPLQLTVSCFSKSRLVLPFWYRLTWVVLDKGQMGVCTVLASHRASRRLSAAPESQLKQQLPFVR